MCWCMCLCVCVCARMHPGWCQSRHDLSCISAQRGGGLSSQKPGVTRSGQRSLKVLVLSGYQRASWELDVADQDQIGFQELTGQTKAYKCTQTHTFLAD